MINRREALKEERIMAYEVKRNNREVVYPTGDQQKLIHLFSELTGVPEQTAKEFIVRDGLDTILQDPSVLGVPMEMEMKVRSLRDLFRAMGGVGV